MSTASPPPSEPWVAKFAAQPPLDFLPALARRLARTFGAAAAELSELDARLRAGPPEPSDIATVHEVWRAGTLRFARRSEWDWHDLRGIFCREERLEASAAGLPSDERFRLERDWRGVRVDVALRDPAAARVRRILRVAAAEDRKRPTARQIAPFALQT